VTTRRAWIGGAFTAAAASAKAFAGRWNPLQEATPAATPSATPVGERAAPGAVTPHRISLAQWSLHRAIAGGTIDPVEFPTIAKRDYGISGVEYVNSFYKSRMGDAKGLAAELKRRSSDSGVTSVLIMCDGEGDLGAPDTAARAQAVENHVKWLELAQALGCHSIRVNARSDGSREEQAKLAAEGLRSLSERAASFGQNVIVENHGGLSSHGDWLAGVIRSVGLPNCGTLPDFGNFYEYDRYQGVRDLMPFAKGVSAKSYDFSVDAGGAVAAETKIDFTQMLSIVRGAKYTGWIGIEYEGNRMSEPDGIKATRDLLVRLGCVA